MKTYRLFGHKGMFVLRFIVAAVAVFVGLLSILGFWGGYGGAQLVGLLFVVFAGHSAYRYLRIRIQSFGATIEFKAILRTMAMAPSEIISVKPAEPGFLLLRSRRGNVLLLNQFDGMHEFLTQIKAVNPTVELRDC